MNFPTISSIQDWVEANYGLKTNPKKLAGEVDLNYYLEEESGEEFILKIASKDSSLDNLMMQSAMLQHLEATAPHINLPRLIKNPKGEAIGKFTISKEDIRFVRLLSWVSWQALGRDTSAHR